MSEGNLPNIEYRSIPRTHLRQHPLYFGLSRTSPMNIENPVDVRLFGEDTMEWNRLHFGRLTTSRLAAYLGLYEKKPSLKLGIPHSLRGHEKGFHVIRNLQEEERLIGNRIPKDTLYKELLKSIGHRYRSSGSRNSEPRVVSSLITRAGIEVLTYEEIIQHYQSLTSTLPPNKDSSTPSEPWSTYLPRSTSALWKTDASLLSSTLSSSSTTVMHEETMLPPLYTYHPSSYPSSSSSSLSSVDYVPSTDTAARLQWGSVQEEIGILTALNYLVGQPMGNALRTTPNTDPRNNHCTNSNASSCAPQATDSAPSSYPFHSRMYEVGLCCLESLPSLPSSCTDLVDRTQLPLMGATPDGLIIYGNGTIEVVEVKSVSPFRENEYYSSTHYIATSATERSSNYKFIIADRGPQDSVGPWIIPQLQMEILCAGPLCTGANLVSQSSTRGARIFFVPRNDEYISLMLQVVAYVYKTYGRQGGYGKIDHGAPKKSKQRSATDGPKIPHDYGYTFPHYSTFVDMTLRLARSAQIRTTITQEYIQRSPVNGRFFLDRYDEQDTEETESEGKQPDEDAVQDKRITPGASISLEELEQKLLSASLRSVHKSTENVSNATYSHLTLVPSVVTITTSSSISSNYKQATKETTPTAPPLRNSLVPSQVLLKSTKSSSFSLHK